MTAENEKRFLLLLSSFMQEDIATKSAVLDYIEEKNWIILSNEDLQIRKNRNELIWRNDLAYVRKHLAMEGMFISSERNNWSITEKGIKALVTLFQEVLCCKEFFKISPTAISTAKEFLSVEVVLQLMDSDEFCEGKVSYVKHIVRERNRELIATAKTNFKRNHNGKLYCEICGFDFANTYGEIGNDFIEAHHTKPVSKMQEGEKTKVEDIAMVCSNCHSMIHRRKPWLTLEQLKKIKK